MKSYGLRGALWGLLFGLGAPVGAVFMRLILLGSWNPVSWFSELREHESFYWYMGMSVPVVFLFFGYTLGIAADKLFLRNSSLARKNSVFKHRSMTDDITGLYNHRELLIQVDKEIDRSRRTKTALSGIMLDVDDFKKVNDEHGHLTGDSVLKEVAGILFKSIRKIDIVGRYGGDEFLIVLPNTRSGDAHRVADRIHTGVRGHRFHAGNKTLPVSISIGLVTFTQSDTLEPKDFIRKVDNAMLAAKKGGKDATYSEEAPAHTPHTMQVS